MKTLRTIQTLSKVGKILSTIVYIFCIIGFCGCVAGILCIAAGEEAFNLNGKSLNDILMETSEMNLNTLYISMTVGAILCAGEAVLAKFAQHYFKRELRDGTPFTLDGANEMKRLGILIICIPLGTRFISEIVGEIMKTVMSNGVVPDMAENGSIALGAVFILMALICRYGAEKISGQEQGTVEE